MDSLVTGTIDMNLLVKLLMSLAGLGAAYFKLRSMWINHKDKRERESIEQMRLESKRKTQELQERIERHQVIAMRAMKEMFNTMYAMTKGPTKSCDRVIIFNGHNSGGLPIPGKPYYVSAVHSSLSEAAPLGQRPEDLYKNLMVDGFYIGMLLQSYDQGTVEIVTDNMPDCLLKDYYLQAGVSHSIVFRIKFIGMTYIFGSAAKLGEMMTPSELRETHRMINLMKTHMAVSLYTSSDQHSMEM